MPTPDPDFILRDWSWSTMPPPVLELAVTDPGDQFIELVIRDDEYDLDPLVTRRLLPEQAVQFADELRARAAILDPAVESHT